jgi:hypothetical protein
MPSIRNWILQVRVAEVPTFPTPASAIWLVTSTMAVPTYPQSCTFDEDLNVWSAKPDLAEQYGLEPMPDELKAKLLADVAEKARLGE